ncbi:hypothetical protein SESBI_43695 [Sesbania bispinosa]|nr:hypothetical protein SESBI_43695 [Sesbania bispinosa]
MDFSLGGSESDSESSDFEILGENGSGSSSAYEESDAAGEGSDAEAFGGGETAANMVEAVEEEAIVPVAKKRRLRPEEIRTRGSGDLVGYFIRMDSESKKEDEYDFISFPWVKELVATTRSIYTDEKTISAFVDSRDVVDGNLPGNVKCTWMMEDDRVCSRVSSDDCRPFVLVLSRPLGLIPINSQCKRKILIAYAPSFKYFKDHFFRLRSEEGKPEYFRDESGKLKFPLYWSHCPVGILGIDSAALTKEEAIEVKFLKGLPPLRCIKLIRFGDDPVKLKTFMDQMAPKLDKKTLMLEMKRQRLAAANKEKVGASSSVAAPELPNIEPIQTVAPTSLVVGSRKRGRNDKTPLSVTGHASEKKDAQGDKVANLEAKLLGYEEMKTKVAELEGRVALLGQENTKLKEDKTTAEKGLLDMTSERDSLKTGLENEKLKIKSVEERYTLDFKQLNSDAAKSYGLGFEQALAQAKHFNPNIEVSGCDPLKKIVKGVLVDLGVGDEEDGSVTPENREEIGDSQGGDFDKPADDIYGVGDEDQGNAPA